MTGSELVWVVSNLLITSAYLVVCVRVAPLLPFKLLTRMTAVIFFAFCGLTHFEGATHVIFQADHLLRDSLHGYVIHGVQAVSAWVFVFLALHENREHDRGRRR